MKTTQADCLRCPGVPSQEGQTLCEPCLSLPRCEVCEVIFGGLVEASTTNPNRCEGCIHFEHLIDFKCCNCKKRLPVYMSKKSLLLHYIVRGNYCGGCNADAKDSTLPKEEKKQFVGYLALLEKMYNAGVISKYEWDRCIRLNPQDVTYWEGLDIDLEDVVEFDEAELALLEEET